MLPANISSVEPVPLVASCGLVRPREEVVVSISKSGGVCYPILAGAGVWPDQLTLAMGECDE